MTPDPQTWLALDEGERNFLVEDFHRQARIYLPKSARALHAAIHVIVENQLALADQVIVRATLQRLMDAGLTRHDAVHAIGSVLAEHTYNILHGESDTMDDHADYYAALQQLTVEKWRHGE